MTIFNDTDILHHATKSKIDRIAASLAAEYPVLTLEVVRNESGDTVTGIALVYDYEELTDQGRIEIDVYSPKSVPDVTHLAGACEDAELDPEILLPEESGPSGSIVDASYRKHYREVSSTGRCNGDWLAEELARLTILADGKTDMVNLEQIFIKNGLDLSAKWANARGNGWQGRYRMNGRQVLEKAVVKAGGLYDAHGEFFPADGDWLQVMRTKHAKWLAKEAKKDEAAEKVAEASVG